MPLSNVNFVANTGRIRAADMLAFYNLFTGQMIDQPVAFADTLAVGGFQPASSAPLSVKGVLGQTANMLELRTLAADTQPVFALDPLGKHSWGSGGLVGADIALSRLSAGVLLLTGGIQVTGVSNFGRIRAAVGTTPGVGQFVLSSAWGSTASLSVVAGSTDQRGSFIVTPGGAGITANPVVTYTFVDGAWPASGFMVCQLTGGTGAAINLPPVNVSLTTTTATFQMFFTPTSGLSYIFTWMALG